MEKFRAGKPSRQLKAIVRSVFVCMPVYYEVKPDNLTVLDEILFFPIFRARPTNPVLLGWFYKLG